MTVQPTTLARTLSVSGSLESAQEVTITPLVAGVVDAVHVETGDVVAEGDPLFSVLSPSARTRVTQAEASLAKAEANLQKLQSGATDAERARQERAIETATRALAQAQASLATTKRSGATDVASSEAAVRSATAKLASAQRDSSVSALLASNDVANLQDQIVAAQRKLGTTKEQRTVHARLADSKTETAERTRDQAAQDLATARSALASAPPTATPEEFAALQTAVRKAENTYAQAEDDLSALEDSNDLQAQQDDDSVASAEESLTQLQRQLPALQAKHAQQDADAQASVEQAASDLTLANAQLTRTRSSVALQQQSAEVAVAKAEADLANAEADLATLTEPADAADLAGARAEVATAEADLADARENLENTTVTAPFAGTIASFTGTVGQSVETQDSLGVLSDLAALRVLMQIPQTDVSVVRAGQEARVTFDSFPGVALTGSLDAPERTPTVSQGVVFYRAHVVLTPGQTGMEQLSPGVTATVTIRALTLENVLVVPLRALSGTAEQRVVRVLQPDGSAQERSVTLGQRGDDGVEITSGLQAGDRVVLSGSAPASASGTGIPSSAVGQSYRQGGVRVGIPGFGGGPPPGG